MKYLAIVFGLSLSGALAVQGQPVAAASQDACAALSLDGIPGRRSRAPSGSAVMDEVLALGGGARDAVLADHILAGNIPSFLRDLQPVSMAGQSPEGRAIEVTICVTPDYLAVGSDRDYVRTPLGLPAAARIADRLGLFLPTPRMVDAIYAQAGLRLAPSPMAPTSAMSSTNYFWRHNGIVEEQGAPLGWRPGMLTAGQKKDVVLTTRLRAAPGRVAIYGWHRPNGRPIQPLSTVHGAAYADYSHGIRLVSHVAFVNGKPLPLATILQDPVLSRIVSDEGPITDPEGLQASLYH